jgi:hypothetical protein
MLFAPERVRPGYFQGLAGNGDDAMGIIEEKELDPGCAEVDAEIQDFSPGPLSSASAYLDKFLEGPQVVICFLAEQD